MIYDIYDIMSVEGFKMINHSIYNSNNTLMILVSATYVLKEIEKDDEIVIPIA